MKKYLIPIHLILACIALYCINTLYYGSETAAFYQSYNIFMLPVVIGLAYVLNKGIHSYMELSGKRWIYAFCGTIFSVFFVFGTQIMTDGCIVLKSALLWLSILILAYVFTAFVTFLAQTLLPALYNMLITKSYPALDKIFHKLNFPLFWMIIFLCWLPVLLACYPGIFSYDAVYQCSQVGDTLQLNTHHPIIHTLLLGGCVHFGQSVFGSANTGMLLYSLIQMLINSCIFAYVLAFLKKHKVASSILGICLLFFALVPFNSLFAVCATKDSIFGALFILFITFIIDMVTDSDTFFRSLKYPVCFSLVVFLLLTFRNNMLYAFILCIPFFLFIFRKHWKKNLILLLMPLIILKLYEGILYPALNVTSGNSREAYSVIMQQFGCVYNECELDTDDQEMLLAIMNDEAWKKYEPHKSDAIKNEFTTEVFEENIVDYMKLWLKLGLKHPSQYLNAFLNLTYGYWYPNDILPDTTTYRKYIEVYTGTGITFDSKIPWLLDKIEQFGMESSYQSIPGLSMLFSPGFYVWILLFMCAHSFYQKHWKFFTVLLPLAALFLTLLLGPVALLRYMYPIMLCVPVICATYTNLKNAPAEN